MMPRIWRLAAATGAVLLALVPAAQLQAADVHAPKSGARYGGTTDEGKRISIRISGKSVELVAFRFECVEIASGATSLQSIRLRRTDIGYRFKIRTRGIVSYADEAPDENAAISIRGQFSRNAKTIKGRLRVDAPRCDTGDVSWRAARRSE